MRLTKPDLDALVAQSLGEDKALVEAITTLFFRLAIEALADGTEVSIRRFGRFKTIHLTVANQLHSRVHFQKSRTTANKFLALKRRHKMEKYGVDESTKQIDLEKAASSGCPECGATLIKQGNILLCPKHGSEPFEANKDGS